MKNQVCRDLINVTFRFARRAAAYLHRENGQTLVEYGLITMIVSIAAVSVLVLIGGEATALYTWASGSVEAVTD